MMRAGLLEVGKLERDRGADDRLLPVVGDGTAAAPSPSSSRACDRRTRGRWWRARRERLVGAEHQMDRARQDERRFVLDIGERRIGGEPDDAVADPIADVVAAGRSLRHRLAVVVGRPHANGDARQAGHRLDDANDLRRAEHAAEVLKARREIGDADLAAVPVGQRRDDDRGVALILRLVIDHAVQHDVGESLLLVARETGARRPDRRRSAESTTRRGGRSGRPAPRSGRCR